MKFLDVPRSGSQAATTSSRNRFGQYTRSRVSPVQPRTPAQVQVRGYLAELSAGWSQLTDAQRSAWNNWAAGSPRTDSLGQTVYQTGLQAFVGVNIYHKLRGGDITQDPPTAGTPATPVLAAPVINDTPLFTVEMLFTLPDDNYLAVYASPPVSPGITFNRDFRYLGMFDKPSPSGPVVLTSAYVAKFGSLPLGKKVFLRAMVFDSIGSRISAECVVAGVVVT